MKDKKFFSLDFLPNTVFSSAKLLLHERVRESDFSLESLSKLYPITLELGPSGKCNNHCDFCMHGRYYNNSKNMPFSMYKKLIDEVSSYELDKRTKGMIFSSSGEPTLNPKIVDFIHYTKEKGIDVALISNGSALRKEGLIEAIVQDVNWTRISLNAGSPKKRAEIHGVSIKDYHQVLKSLSKLSVRKKEIGSKVNIGAQIVVTERNHKEIDSACRDVRNTGIDYFQIKPVVFHPLDGRDQLSREFWEKVLTNAEEVAKKYGDKNFDVFVKCDQFSAIMKPDHDKSAYNTCLSLFFPIIEADGKVYHCSQTRGIDSLELGDLNKQTFKEIWDGEKRKEIIKRIDIDKCQPVCRCHANNKLLTHLVTKGYTPDLQKRAEDLMTKGGYSPSFV